MLKSLFKFVFFTASHHQVPLLGPGRGRLLFERQVVVRRRTHETVQDSNADTSWQNACHYGQTERIPNSVKLTINGDLHTEDRRALWYGSVGVWRNDIRNLLVFLQSSQLDCTAFVVQIYILNRNQFVDFNMNPRVKHADMQVFGTDVVM